ncbi:AAA family ATPase [Mycobacterium sp.]|uniref:AAA family ATPase n=1 Tax=Mycobacterium sp. TaxID=1785 RepID=UPI0031DDF309
MRLHRLVLTNYRGITHREVDFPDHGVVVVHGVNEAGKSSMIEALDLLLEHKDRSTKKEVKQVKPTNVDAGSQITAEISTGPYRFVYHKRFHKRPETELTVLAPRREQLTGDEAHDRVRAILAETVDTELWRAQRVLQAASTTAVDLSGCDALSRALDIAAGDAATLSGAESSLLERIDAEYARYFTSTGRPTGEWSAVSAAREQADEEVQRCTVALAEVEERVACHEKLSAELAELSGDRRRADERYRAALQAAEAVEHLTAQLREAELAAAVAAATGSEVAAAHDERQRLLADVARHAAALAARQAEARQTAAAEESARGAAAAADTAVEKAEQAVAAAQQRVEELRRRQEADRLAARLDAIDAARRDRDQVCDELSTIRLTEDLMARIEQAAAAADRAEAQLASLSATVEFIAAADIELVVEGGRMSLSAGQSWSTAVSATTEVTVPDVLTARFSPGLTAADVHGQLASAQRELAAALAAGHVEDAAAARSTDQHRRELQSRRDQLAANLAGLCGGEEIDGLRATLAQLLAGLGAVRVDDAELDRARAVQTAAAEDRKTCRLAADTARTELTEAATRATVARDTAAGHQAELAAVTERLAERRAARTDEDLAAAAETGLRATQAARCRVAELTDALTAAGPDAVAAELADARRAAEALHTRHDEITQQLREISAELGIFRTEGRQGNLDAAQTRREHALDEYQRVRQRAEAAQLLRSVMARHRDAARLRYVEPFRAELQRLGRPVFGPSFEVDVDSDLRICNRTLDGCTVPYESLSGGAKEQLGILARLAGAALVAEDDTVPVLIDDALGFTDLDRLAKMAAVFDAVGSHGQVIVLTCTPARYDGVTGAHHIDLSTESI